MLENPHILSYLNNYFFPINCTKEDFITKINILNKREQRTTIVLNNINLELTSELINKKLEKIYNEKRTYNSIYTLREEWDIYNSGSCYINFINSVYILNLLDNIDAFNGKKKCVFFCSYIQGDEFYSLMSEKRKKEQYLDFIVFNDY